MPTYTSSANMALPIPIVGTTPGPDYATDINSCLTLIDQHDHSSGYGVQITPSGLNINADLSLQSNDATSVRSVRFTAQGSPITAASPDLGCIYESGVDLYYNDGSGNQIRLTQAGSVAGTSGSIASLASPASATYVAGSGTFVWQSAANTPAIMDGASVIIRNPTAAANGTTIAAANALASSYTLTLPSALPASQKIVTIDASGNVAAPYTIDNSSLEISANVIQIKDSGVSTAKIAASGVTTAKIADLNVTTAKINDLAVTAAKIANGTITSTQMTAGTVSGSFISTDVLLAGSDVKINNKTTAVSWASESHGLAIIRGTFTAAGAVTGGAGFACTPGATSMTLTFTATASSPTVFYTSDNSTACTVVKTTSVSTTTVVIADVAGAAVPAGHVLIISARPS